MKSLLSKLGVILMAVVIFYPYNSFAEIEIKYDRFRNRTVVQIDPEKVAKVAKSSAFVLIGGYDGQTPSRPAICSLGFYLRSQSWRFLDCHPLYCLADGRPVQLPPSKHSGLTGEGYVIEQIFVRIPFSIVEQLSKCKKIEFKLCNTELSLSSYEMEDLKTFVKAFK